MPLYKTTSAVRCDGDLYPPEDIIDLDKETAAPLLKLGVLKPTQQRAADGKSKAKET